MRQVIPVNEDLIRSKLEKLPRDCHKGSNGTLSVVAGSPQFRGAAVLCVSGALRTGCGIVRLISCEKVITAVSVHYPSCVFSTAESSEELQKAVYDCSGSSAFLAGCGLSVCDRSATAVYSVLGTAKKAVLDADALNIISLNPEMKNRLEGTVVTPHIGEFSRLCGLSVADIKKDPFTSALDFSEKYGTVTVLKDYKTIIATPGGRIYLSENASEGLSKGGSGDVLAGIISGFLAQSFTPEEAAVTGVAVHAAASLLCAEAKGVRSMLPSELGSYVCELFRRLGY